MLEYEVGARKRCSEGARSGRGEGSPALRKSPLPGRTREPAEPRRPLGRRTLPAAVAGCFRAAQGPRVTRGCVELCRDLWSLQPGRSARRQPREDKRQRWPSHRASHRRGVTAPNTPLPTPNARVQRGDAGPALVPVTISTRDNPTRHSQLREQGLRCLGCLRLSCHSQGSSSEPNLRQEQEEGLPPLPPRQGTESQLCQQEGGGYCGARAIFPPAVSCQGISHPTFQFWKARINLLPAVTARSPSSSCLLGAYPGLRATRLLLMLRCNRR